VRSMMREGCSSGGVGVGLRFRLDGYRGDFDSVQW
jgi:hypothetical protein